MIRLHVLGRSDDGTRFLLAAHPDAENAGYEVEIDDRVVALLGRGGGRRVTTGRSTQESEPEQEVEPERELPTGPLDVDSPAAALEAAHGLWLVRDEDGPSDATLHDAVLANLHKRNVRVPDDILEECWWVTKLGETAWQVSFRFVSRGRIHEAEWVLDTEHARLVPENKLAEALGWWKPPKPRRSRSRRRRSGGSGGGGGGGGARNRGRARSGSGSGS